jgi:ABC-type dipeptide/oligopeptide/nickel transport system permease subunit
MALLLVPALILFAGFGASHAIDLDRALLPPSKAHWLGTDHLGRDLAARLAAGGWRSLLALLLVAAIAVPLGLGAGLAAAVAGARLRGALLGLARAGVAVPVFVLALAFTAVAGLSPVTAGLAIGLAAAAQYALVSAGLARAVMGGGPVRAAAALGVSRRQIAWRHVLPELWPVLRRHLAADLGRAVLAYAGLAFIGLGAETGQPDWGAMVWEYRGFLFEAPWLLAGPVAAVALLALALHAALDHDESVAQRPLPGAAPR